VDPIPVAVDGVCRCACLTYRSFIEHIRCSSIPTRQRVCNFTTDTESRTINHSIQTTATNHLRPPTDITPAYSFYSKLSVLGCCLLLLGCMVSKLDCSRGDAEYLLMRAAAADPVTLT
jgi:hypothetical protein